jgi:hypothetical protein
LNTIGALSCDSTKFFVSTEKAIVVTGLAHRRPEPHPGLIVHSVPIAIRLKRSPFGLFAPPALPRT